MDNKYYFKDKNKKTSESPISKEEEVSKDTQRFFREIIKNTQSINPIGNDNKSEGNS